MQKSYGEKISNGKKKAVGIKISAKEAVSAFLKKNIVVLLGILVGIITFLCIFGRRVLNVTYTDWLLGGGDLTQNYLGWCFYRNSDWTFPIGLMDQIAYPNKVSVLFTDSVPLFAVFFKLFRGILPAEFQYFGIWGLLCFAAQGALGSLLIHHYVKKVAEAAVGSVFFILTPIMLGQMSVNLALGGQWLILASLWAGIGRGHMNWRQSLCRWAVLGLLAAGIQLYFIPICGIVLLGFLLSDVIRRKRIQIMLAGLGGYLAGAVGMTALLGGFSHNHVPASTYLGQASFNLNGFFNSQGWSQFIELLPVYGSKAETGLAYPGTGIFLILILGAVTWMVRVGYRFAVKKEKRGFRLRFGKNGNAAAYLILALICFVIALSPVVSWGSSVVAEWNLPEWILALWGRVGSSGRFIWPVVYLIILGSVVFMEKQMPWEMMAAVLLVVLAVCQVWDGKWQLMQRQVQFGTDYTYHSPLKSEHWEKWAEDGDIEHMVFVSYMVEDRELIYELSAYAARNGLSVNDFASACQTIRLAAAEDLLEALTRVRDDTLYIYKSADAAMCNNPQMEYTEADGVIVGKGKEEKRD